MTELRDAGISPSSDGGSSGFVIETHGLRKTFESEGAPVRAAVSLANVVE